MKRYLVFILCISLLQNCGSKRIIYNYEDDRKEVASKKRKVKKKKKEKDKKPIIPIIRTTDDYIKYYSEIAMDEMRQYKIPASITLAQGILESGSGKGRLATNANNHFGIKCHDWNGPKIYHDDDKKQECFRKYSSPEFSYRDHSIFLSSRERYADLFKLKKDDYKSWAKGLKKAGYATDRKYSQKLIDLIDRYKLYRYDDIVLKKKKSKEKFYKVKKGDTLYSISKKFNISIEDLINYNNLDSEGIAIGQQIIVGNK
tara:strand:+ start:8899 stop:9672 length:774 start_codon:yes stop_codon:yes gene_type:complete